MHQGASLASLEHRVSGQGVCSAWWRCWRKPHWSRSSSRAGGKKKGIWVSRTCSMTDTWEIVLVTGR